MADRKNLALLMSVGLLAAVAGGTGCMVADGSYTYAIEGTLVDASTGAPVGGADVGAAVEGSQLPDPYSLQPSTSSDASGDFAAVYGYGLTWGATYVFGVPIVSGDPIPPMADAVILSIRINGHEQTLTLPVTAQEQATVEPGQRTVRLGTIEIAVGSP